MIHKHHIQYHTKNIPGFSPSTNIGFDTSISTICKFASILMYHTAGIHIHSGPSLSVSEPYRFLPATIQDTQGIPEQFYLTPNIGVQCTAMQSYVDKPLIGKCDYNFSKLVTTPNSTKVCSPTPSINNFGTETTLSNSPHKKKLISKRLFPD